MNIDAPQPTPLRKRPQKMCPICHRLFSEDFGALSRADNETLICSACGTVEALEPLMGLGKGHDNE